MSAPDRVHPSPRKRARANRARADRAVTRPKPAPDAISSRDIVMVGVVALAVRLVVLFQLSTSPSFLVPLIDEQSYDSLARQLVARTPLDEHFFWQPFLYPFFLAAVYGLTHGSILAARLVQVVLGALAAALTARVGQEIGGRTIGMIAGLIVAFYGPLIYSETELLATGWEVLWAVLLLWITLRLSRGGGALWLVVFGIVGGLSILTRPTFLPFVGIAAIWLIADRVRRRNDWWRVALQASYIAIGLLITLLPVAALDHRATGTFTFLPYSGGINFHIGNNLDIRQTLYMRPGPEWQRFAGQPMEHGVVGAYARQGFFMRMVYEYVWQHPLHFLSGLVMKALQFVNAYELPRNIDMYVFRTYSPVFAALTWRVGGFGFPFAVLFAFAVVGLVFAWRRFPRAWLLFLVLMPVSVILVFVSARYRMVVIPLLAIAAAFGSLALIEFWKGRRWARLGASAALVGGSLVLTSLPDPFAPEKADYASEMLTWVATWHAERGDAQGAEPLLNDALRRDARNKMAWNALGIIQMKRGDLRRAAESFERALALDSLYGDAHQNDGYLHILRSDPDGALLHYRKALFVDPSNAVAVENVGVLLEQMGLQDSAAFYFKRLEELQQRRR